MTEISLIDLPGTWSWRLVRCGLSKTRLAELLECKYDTVRFWCSGQAAPSFETVARVENILAQYGDKITLTIK